MNAATLTGAAAATGMALAGVSVFALMAAGVGNRALRWAGLAAREPAEQLLSAAGLGVVIFELDCLLLAVCGGLRVGIWLSLAAASLIVWLELPGLNKLFTELWASSRGATRGAKLLRWALAAVLLVEGVAAMAPLTGSDALHYHFAAPQWVLLSGFHPNFFSTNSFLTGQGHMLILAGLALRSEKLALGLLYLGGVLTALAGACVARKWMPETGAWVVALAFVLTPVVFWQMSTAGTPDLWIAFFAVLTVLQVSHAVENREWKNAALAGVFAGTAAGSKYTGCMIAASAGLALVLQSRLWKAAMAFAAGAVNVGVWPYFRNWLWTGDPVFPLLMKRLQPEDVNAPAMAAFLASTGADVHRSVLGVVRYPVFAAIDASKVGFWQFLGPMCLCFAPLVIFAVRRTALWRTVLIVWLLSAVGIGMTSGMPRFVLPVYPLALAAVMAGVWAIPAQGWGALRGMATATLTIFLGVSAMGLLVYQRHALGAAVGMKSRDAYLQEVSPDYGKVRFVNEALSGRETEGKVLVFFRHTYGLNVQVAYGNPEASWAVDPGKLRDEEAWGELFQHEGIRWVVRSPQYPAAIRGPFEQMEADGELVPIATAEVEDFAGNRMQGVREKMPVVILEVRAMAALRLETFWRGR
jgi:hypothetical protein